MNFYRDLQDVPSHPHGRTVSVGVFDGVHRGHRRIFEQVLRYCADRGFEPTAVTFDPHPLAVLRPEDVPQRLSSLDERIELLAAIGVGSVVVLPFTRELSQLSPRQFVQSILVRRLSARAVFEGPNFRFGHRGAGDIGELGRLGQELGFEVGIVPPVTDGGEVISSSLVRGFLQEGDVVGAARCLGRPYRVDGPIVAGARRGRQLGFPTANVVVPPDRAMPARGVYAVFARTQAGTARVEGMANLGTRPTFDGRQIALEVHLFGWDEDLYGRSIEVEFVARLRPERRFAGVVELTEQLRRDRVAAKAALADFTGRPGHDTLA